MVEPTAFVYPYLAAEAAGEELRYSIRSVAKHFVGEVRFWVVGDRPGWYEGDFLDAPRRSATVRACADLAAKMLRVFDEPAIPETFVWMMDDVYLLGPMTLDALRQPRARGRMTVEQLAVWRPRRLWLQDKRRAWELLAARGRPLHDYCVHLPYVYEKTRMRRLFEWYPLGRESLPLSLLYFNEFAEGPPLPVEPVLHRECRRPSLTTLRRRVQESLILNHGHDAYTPAMARLLAERFPEPSPVEHT
ncbi:MAG: hypothetical protein JW818_05985 [Pirellulales bacterium]|nr:hypothetical protein [Pirellulales bacterium]